MKSAEHVVLDPFSLQTVTSDIPLADMAPVPQLHGKLEHLIKVIGYLQGGPHLSAYSMAIQATPPPAVYPPICDDAVFNSALKQTPLYTTGDSGGIGITEGTKETFWTSTVRDLFKVAAGYNGQGSFGGAHIEQLRKLRGFERGLILHFEFGNKAFHTPQNAVSGKKSNERKWRRPNGMTDEDKRHADGVIEALRSLSHAFLMVVAPPGDYYHYAGTWGQGVAEQWSRYAVSKALYY